MISLKETKRIKDAINENPSDFKNIIENTNIGICITDSKGYFFIVNDNYTKVYGYSKQELIGSHFSLVLAEGQKEQMSRVHDQFIKNQFEILRTWTVKTKSGEMINISVDAGYTEKINGTPMKITFIQKE